MLYLSGAVVTALPPEAGVMLTPNKGNRVPLDRLWAADTGCFTQPQRHDDERYLRWLEQRLPHVERCCFATAPDVVGEAAATLERSGPMLRRIRDVGFPAALVAQDGMVPEQIPWDEFDALFIGGTTEWKLGREAATLAGEARRRGLWVHMGRVNGLGRMWLAHDMGCHSVDGTGEAFNPGANIPKLKRRLERFRAQPMLPMEVMP